MEGGTNLDLIATFAHMTGITIETKRFVCQWEIQAEFKLRQNARGCKSRLCIFGIDDHGAAHGNISYHAGNDLNVIPDLKKGLGGKGNLFPLKPSALNTLSRSREEPCLLEIVCDDFVSEGGDGAALLLCRPGQGLSDHLTHPHAVEGVFFHGPYLNDEGEKR